MKLLIEIDEGKYNHIKNGCLLSVEVLQNAIANGTPYNPSGDLISREALKKAIEEVEGNYDGYEPNDLGRFMNKVDDLIDDATTLEIPAARWDCYCEGQKVGYEKALSERPKGEWIKEDDEHLKGWYRCSECGRRVEDLTDDVIIHAGCDDYTIADIYPYCHCGAEMKGGENNVNESI